LKKALRINLTDFIEDPLEKDVIYFLGFIFRNYDSKKIKIKLKLWYNDNEIDREMLDKFKKVYKIFIDRYDVEIEKIKYHENVWYDIISTKRDDKLKNNFSSKYTTVSELISGISDFNSMLTFLVTKDTPNGRKNKNRGYRVKAVAKSDKD